MTSAQTKRTTFYGDNFESICLPSARVIEKGHGSGEVLPPHRHARAYLSFVLLGGYRETVRGQTFACGPGTLVVHPPDETHEDVFGSHRSRLLVVEPDPEALGEHGAAAFDRRIVLSGPLVRRLMGNVRQELARRDSLSSIAVQGALLELAAEILRSKARPDGNRTRPPAWLRRAHQIVVERFTESVQLGTLAEEVGIHPSHLAREFRRFYGTSVGELIRSLRVRHALERIGSASSLAALALESGFADQSHFTRTFRDTMGTTPSAYRARLDRQWSSPDGSGQG